METSPQIQRKSIVRIVIKTDIGTGILVLPEGGQCVYIVTAKHVLLGKTFTDPLNKSDIVIDRIINGAGEFISYQVKESDHIVIFDQPEDDTAIIIISRNDIDLNFDSLSKLNYIDSDYGLSHCSARGFPNLGSITPYPECRSFKCFFEEFKGTGNSEVHMDRKLMEKRVFPCMDINKSGTRKEDLLVDKQNLAKIWILRKGLQPMNVVDSMEFLIDKISATKTNGEFITSMNS